MMLHRGDGDGLCKMMGAIGDFFLTGIDFDYVFHENRPDAVITAASVCLFSHIRHFVALVVQHIIHMSDISVVVGANFSS